jgi:glycosyltransferase involved in cell wall biosynthesis
MPTRNEWPSVRATIRSIAATRRLDALTQIVVVDDHSRQPCRSQLDDVRSQLVADRIELTLVRSDTRLGVAGARNLAVAHAHGDVLFITDSHVRFSRAWDKAALEQLSEDRILATTIRDTRSSFVGYGCDLSFPFMGTRWVPEPRDRVPVACSAGTILHRACFDAIGGYDEGMARFGGIEPEFSIRAWLSGIEIIPTTDIDVYHRFKPPTQRTRFAAALRADVVHNSLRFGLLYLNRELTLQMLRYFATFLPEESMQACRALAASDVWDRREALERSLTHDFDWFIELFDLRDQLGRPLRRGGSEHGATRKLIGTHNV